MKNSSEWDTEANYGVAAEMMPATAECVVHWRCAKCGRRRVGGREDPQSYDLALFLAWRSFVALVLF
jgi:hypothetical protein